MISTLLDKLKSCYEANDFSDIRDYLSPECVFSAQWVLDDISGAEAVEAYFVQIAKNIAQANAVPTAEVKHALSPVDADVLVLTQTNGTHTGQCIIMIGESGGKISSIEMCMPELFTFEQ